MRNGFLGDPRTRFTASLPFEPKKKLTKTLNPVDGAEGTVRGACDSMWLWAWSNAKEIYCLARVFMAYPRFVRYIFTSGPARNARADQIIVSGSVNSAYYRSDCRA